MDIGDWLRSLGLERYEPAFRENEIDWEALPRLTVDDLKDLGVVLGGHRRKLLDAIQLLGAAQPEPAGETLPTRPQLRAERRQLTVMFCDLVGSTALSARFDPEDLREIVGAYHRAVADTVATFGGFVAKYMGDGVLIYFGYPQAHEDDPERAVRAALAVLIEVAKLEFVEPLQVRLGIASGLVVVGDLIGEGAAQERGIVGETPNLAARLQALAKPNSVVIAENTRRQLGTLFEVEDLGRQALAGFGEPQGVWQVISESGVLSRFEALRSGTTPLVGREEELELLLRRWQQAKGGEGRAVLLAGEPGIGKSRLTAAVAERIESEPHIRLRYFCSPHHEDSPLHPFIGQLERAADFVRGESEDQRRDKLDRMLAPGATDADEIELIAELLSLPNAAADLNLSPQLKREKLFEAILHQLQSLARKWPVLMVFEDAHWVDPTSRELLDLTIAQLARIPVLLVITFRPEFQAPWAGLPQVTALALNRLGERDVTEFVRGLAANTPLGGEVIEEIIERTDGVPLFIEELTKAVLERAELDKRVDVVLSASPLPALAVPPTLHASLIARLDGTGATAKDIAQIGSVLGREFSYELIEQVAERREAELKSGLDQLTDAGLLFCRGQPPQSSYLFKHALVQDAAYGTLLRARRQELHSRVAAVLEQRFLDLVERQPELLAHHLMAAGHIRRGVDQWLKAGKRAAGRSAHPEAIGHFGRGITALASLPDSTERDRQEIELQLGRGLSLLTAKGFTSPEAAEAYARARELCERHGDNEHLFVALWNLWMTTAVRTPDAARPLSKRLLQLTEADEDSGRRLEALHSAWFTHFNAGEPAVARHHCDEGRGLYDFDRHRSLGLMFGGHDPAVCAGIHGSFSEWLVGYPDRALASSRAAIELGQRLAHPLSLDHSYLWGAVLHVFRGEPDSALQRADQGAALAKEQRLALGVNPDVLRGAAFLAQGNLQDALASTNAGLSTREASGWQMFQPYHLATVAEVLCRAGEEERALSVLNEAQAMIDTNTERWWEAETWRLKGVLLTFRRNLAEAESCFQQALKISRRQQAKSLELRAAMSLANLWADQGRRTEASEMLAPLYGSFTEGFDTADLKKAKALLDVM